MHNYACAREVNKMQDGEWAATHAPAAIMLPILTIANDLCPSLPRS